MESKTLRERIARAIFAELHDVAWEDSAPSSQARTEAKKMASAAIAAREPSYEDADDSQS